MFLKQLNRVFLLGLVLLVCSCSNATHLKVVTLNVEWFPGQGWEPTEDAIAAHIVATRKAVAELEPDLLIATEITDTKLFGELTKEAAGIDLQVVSNFSRPGDDPDRRNQQIGIASKLEAEAGWAEEWKKTKIPDIYRGFTFAALKNPNTGNLIMVYGLHLKSNRSKTPEDEQRNYDMRDESIDQLVAHMEAMTEQFKDRGIDGWIVGGDFNTNHDGRFGDQVVQKLVDAGFYNTWKKVPANKRHTWKASGRFKATTFDYLMVKGFGTPKAKAVEMYQSVSDHNAVVLTIKLPSS